MDAISCLATSFADAALARALHFSMSDSTSSSATTQLYAPLLLCADPAYAPAPVACDSVLVSADSPRRAPRQHQQQQLGPAGARAGKRRSRASKRAPTTYITTDPANFRLMVQQITGVQAEPLSESAVLHPTASVLLAAAADTTAAYGNTLLTAVGADEASLHHHHSQQPCFPTLDSWNVSMYDRSEMQL